MKTLFKLSTSLLGFILVASIVANFFGVELTLFEAITSFLFVSFALALVQVAVAYNDPAKYSKRYHQRLTYGIAVEFWETTVAEFLMREYPWLLRAKDRSASVLSKSVVHIPQAGLLPGGVRNRKNYPAPLVRRGDTEITYVLDEVSTNPSHISNAEMVELSYDKVGEVLNDHIKQLNFLAAFNAMYRWIGKNPNAGGVTNLDLNAANIRRTSGATNAAHLSGATGNRKILTVADISAAKTILINQTKRELNPGKRALILDETMYNQLRSDSILSNNQQYDLVGAVFLNGDLVKIAGFDIIRTDILTRFTNASPPIAKDPLTDADIASGTGIPYSSTAAATDNASALLVDFDFVHIAIRVLLAVDLDRLDRMQRMLRYQVAGLDLHIALLIPRHDVRQLGVGHGQQRKRHSLLVGHQCRAPVQPALNRPDPSPVRQGRDHA